jgi:hypothetical protein
MFNGAFESCIRVCIDKNSAIEWWLGGVELWLCGRFLGKGRHLLESCSWVCIYKSSAIGLWLG